MTSPHERITERVTRLGHPNSEGTPLYLLSIAEFFDGNDEEGSICANLVPIPSPSEVRAALERIAQREDVEDVRIEIAMFDDPDGWPYSETVWVMTSASHEDVAAWFPEDLVPDDIWAGWGTEEQYEPYTVPEGCTPVACWWD